MNKAFCDRCGDEIEAPPPHLADQSVRYDVTIASSDGIGPAGLFGQGRAFLTACRPCAYLLAHRIAKWAKALPA